MLASSLHILVLHISAYAFLFHMFVVQGQTPKDSESYKKGKNQHHMTFYTELKYNKLI